MGVDFIQKTKRPFEKHLDLAAVRLATADLFTRAVSEIAASVAADVASGVDVALGDELVAEVQGHELVFRRGFTEVARAAEVPQAVLQAVGDSCGVATAVVCGVHEVSGVAEITLC